MIDRSDAKDAARFRWLLAGNGYFMEQNLLCGFPETDEDERDDAREKIDEAILTGREYMEISENRVDGQVTFAPDCADMSSFPVFLVGRIETRADGTSVFRLLYDYHCYNGRHGP